MCEIRYTIYDIRNTKYEGVLASIRLCLAAMASADYDSVQRAVDKHSLWIELWNYLSAIDGNDGVGGSARLG